jgi:hypothetical protein
MPLKRSLPISTALNTISLQTFPRVCHSNVSFPHPLPIAKPGSTPLYNVIPPMQPHRIANWKL